MELLNQNGYSPSQLQSSGGGGGGGASSGGGSSGGATTVGLDVDVIGSKLKQQPGTAADRSGVRGRSKLNHHSANANHSASRQTEQTHRRLAAVAGAGATEIIAGGHRIE